MSFKHGGNIKEFAKNIGCRVDEVIDLSSNINFVKPQIDIDFNSLDISAYPNYDTLKESIAKNYKIKTNQLELFNGASTAIYSLFGQLDLKECSLYAPLYLEYKKSAILHGYKINYINRFTDIYHEIKENSLVVFVNPSTPDGEFYNLYPLLKKWIDKNATILIDESFLDFTPFESATNYINGYNKLYIIKSMTKFYSSAGIRVGAIISNSQNIKNIQKREPLWKISQFDSAYIQSSLRDKQFNQHSTVINNKNRDRVIELLEKSRYIEKVYPSFANFVLVRLKDIEAQKFQQKLIPYKIMIRDCSNFDFLDSSFVRIAIKDDLAIDRLREALCESFI
ncbi:MAG TPA: aminotransferase class I/II-fold pyridoxal phosphate-dependent enzyme [Campylobacterales bacterium]|nr:aminotransferase class I/II-fold pyridoxal phosphate-dependent enzyme [Campylobacterales bacterium]